MENNVLVLPSVLKDVWETEYRDKLLSNANSHKLMYYQDIVLNHTTQVYVDENNDRVDTSNNKEIPKGYLIWHEMGTGKTMVGLHFLKKFAKHTSTLKKVGGEDSFVSNVVSNVSNVSKKTFRSQLCKTVLTYESIQNYLKSIQTPPQDHKLRINGIEFEFNDKIVVFDEAQYLVKIFRDDRISKIVRNWFFFRIRKAHRYLFLTGTPLYQKTIDLSFYMNLCEGGRPTEPLLPFSERLFHKKYFKVVRWKQILFGWVIPLLNNAVVKSAVMLFTAGLMTVQLINILGVVTKPDLFISSTQHFDKNSNYIGTEQTIINKYDREKSTTGMDTTRQQHYNRENSTGSSTETANTKEEEFIAISIPKVSSILTSTTGRIMRKFAVAAGFGTLLGSEIGEKYDKGDGIGIGAVWIIPILSVVFLCSILNKLAKYDLNKIHVLNIKKLSQVIGKYISFYTFKPPDTNLFQNVTHKIRQKTGTGLIHVPYSNPGMVSYELRRRYPRELINKDIKIEGFTQSAKVIGIEKKIGQSTKHILKFEDGDTRHIQLAKGSKLKGAKFALDFERNKKVHFKTEVFQKKVIPYNFLQYFLFLDVTTGIVDTKNSVYFEEEDDNTINGQNQYEKYDYQYDIFGDDLYENDNFMKYGRVIGNLTILPEEKIEKQTSILGVLVKYPKALSFDRSLSNKNRLERSSYKTPDSKHSPASLDYIPESLPVETPIKFINMLHDILQQKRVNKYAFAVVYSSFRKNGTYAFLKFIDSLTNGTVIKLINDKRASIEIFTKLVCKFYAASAEEPSDPYDVLFLEPSMTTGISIHRGECLHIMEPIINPNTMDQLKARVNRYNPAGYDTEKKVRVVLYECSAKKHINRLLTKMKHWSQTTDRGRIFWKRFTIFDQELSPDYIVQQKAEKLRYTIQQLSEMLVSVCSLNHTRIVYNKLDHKNYIFEDVEERNKCDFCKTQKVQDTSLRTADRPSTIKRKGTSAEGTSTIKRKGTAAEGTSPLTLNQTSGKKRCHTQKRKKRKRTRRF